MLMWGLVCEGPRSLRGNEISRENLKYTDAVASTLLPRPGTLLPQGQASSHEGHSGSPQRGAAWRIRGWSARRGAGLGRRVSGGWAQLAAADVSPPGRAVAASGWRAEA